MFCRKCTTYHNQKSKQGNGVGKTRRKSNIYKQLPDKSKHESFEWIWLCMRLLSAFHVWFIPKLDSGYVISHVIYIFEYKNQTTAVRLHICVLCRYVFVFLVTVNWARVDDDIPQYSSYKFRYILPSIGVCI